MRVTNFDTLEYLDELKRSGMRTEEAEAITKATAKAFTQILDIKEIGTKSDFKQLEAVLKKEMSDNKLELIKYVSDTKIELLKYTHDTMWKAIGTLATFQTIILGLFGVVQYCLKSLS